MNSDPERAAIHPVAQHLSHQFTNIDTALVTRVVWDTYRHLYTHPTRDVVPILVQDAARDRLRVMPPRDARRATRRRGTAADISNRSAGTLNTEIRGDADDTRRQEIIAPAPSIIRSSSAHRTPRLADALIRIFRPVATPPAGKGLDGACLACRRKITPTRPLGSTTQ